MWRSARDLAAEDPDFDRAAACREIEGAIFKALDNIRMVEGYVDDISKAEVNAESVAKGGPRPYPEVTP